MNPNPFLGSNHLTMPSTLTILSALMLLSLLMLAVLPARQGSPHAGPNPRPGTPLTKRPVGLAPN